MIPPRALVLASFAALWPLALLAPAPQDRASIEVTSQRAGGKVHMLTGRGGNLAALGGPEGLVLVDSQFADMAPKIRAACEMLPREERGSLRFLINTHFHGDHTGGNAELAPAGAIIAHDKVRARLQTDPKVVPASLPVVTFDQNLGLFVNGEELRIEHCPKAHTDGDSVVYFQSSKVVHLGDLFFHGRFPFIDLKSGGSVKGVIENVTRVLDRIDDTWAVIPGHGQLATRKDLSNYRDTLKDCLTLVEKARASGQSWADFQAQRPLAQYEAWNWEFIDEAKFLATLGAEIGWQQ